MTYDNVHDALKAVLEAEGRAVAEEIRAAFEDCCYNDPNWHDYHRSDIYATVQPILERRYGKVSE
jgi:hypothetical protein